MTNRLISEKIVSWDFAPPFDFTAQFLASRAIRRGEQTSPFTSKNLTNPVWCPIFENARTHFERNAVGVSQPSPNPSALAFPNVLGKFFYFWFQSAYLHNLDFIF